MKLGNTFTYFLLLFSRHDIIYHIQVINLSNHLSPKLPKSLTISFGRPATATVEWTQLPGVDVIDEVQQRFPSANLRSCDDDYYCLIPLVFS